VLHLVKALSRDHPWLAAQALRRTLRFGTRMGKAITAPLSAVPTHMFENELFVLYWLAKHLRVGATALEVGSYLGASACFLAAGLRNNGGRLYCVDTWHNDAMNEGSRDTYEDFVHNTQAFHDIITPLRGKSIAVADQYAGPRIDLLFIDGDHTYEGCHNDWVKWQRHLSSEAILAFHDYTRSEVFVVSLIAKYRFRS